MKKLGRQFKFKARTLSRRVRDSLDKISFRHLLLLFEIGVLFVLTVFALSGSRASLFDRLGKRADLILFLTGAIALVALHLFVNRRIGKRLDGRYKRKQLKEREIFFDLSQAASGATTIDELYKLVVETISDALQTNSVSILVRDEKTKDYYCRASSLNVLEETISTDSFTVKRLKNLDTPFAINASDFAVWERAFVSASSNLKEARKRERETLERLKARLLLQIVMKDELIGVVALGERKGGKSFSSEDKQLLMAVASQMAVVIENSKLVERMVEEERMKRELALATEVQQRLFPQEIPTLSSIELAGFCQPARGIGGDYYDFIELDEGQTGIAIADVAGKGTAAALLMSIVQASLRSQAITQSQIIGIEHPLAEIVSTMNKLLWRSSGVASYATFFYAQYNEEKKQLSYVNAGHNPPLLLRSRCYQGESASVKSFEKNISLSTSSLQKVDCEKFEQLDKGGLVLGLFEDFSWEQETIELQSGDLLFAYTDGVTEALNENEEEFGEERLKSLLCELSELSVDELKEKVFVELQKWCGNAPLYDDMTFVILKVK
jgi:phosphoserine phosphatase RsbU/P